jgi:hypothetical protein
MDHTYDQDKDANPSAHVNPIPMYPHWTINLQNLPNQRDPILVECRICVVVPPTTIAKHANPKQNPEEDDAALFVDGGFLVV